VRLSPDLTPCFYDLRGALDPPVRESFFSFSNFLSRALQSSQVLCSGSPVPQSVLPIGVRLDHSLCTFSQLFAERRDPPSINRIYSYVIIYKYFNAFIASTSTWLLFLLSVHLLHFMRFISTDKRGRAWAVRTLCWAAELARLSMTGSSLASSVQGPFTQLLGGPRSAGAARRRRGPLHARSGAAHWNSLAGGGWTVSWTAGHGLAGNIAFRCISNRFWCSCFADC